MRYRVVYGFNKVEPFSTFEAAFEFAAKNKGKVYVREASCTYSK